MILGANSDPSIDVSDPISEHFYKEIWMTTCARNASIYQKVGLSARFPVTEPMFFVLCVSDPLCCFSPTLPGFPLPAVQRRPEHVGAGRLPGQTGPGQGGPGSGAGGAEEDPRLPGPVPASVPVRAEPAAPCRHQRSHGSPGALDLRRPVAELTSTLRRRSE